MGVLRILLDAINRFVQLCAVVIATLLSRGASTPSAAGPGLLRGRNAKIVAAVCSVAILISVVRLLMSMVGPSQKVDLRPYKALGTVCAEETSKLIGSRGQIVVVAPDTSRTKMPVTDAELACLKRGLQRAGGVSVRATEFVPVSRGGLPLELTAAKLKEVLSRYPDANAIVSFVGVPQLKGEDVEGWSGNAPKLVTVGTLDPAGRLNELLARKIVALAILPRADEISSDAKKPKTDREWFEQSFRIMTAASVAKSP